ARIAPPRGRHPVDAPVRALVVWPRGAARMAQPVCGRMPRRAARGDRSQRLTRVRGVPAHRARRRLRTLRHPGARTRRRTGIPNRRIPRRATLPAVSTAGHPTRLVQAVFLQIARREDVEQPAELQQLDELAMRVEQTDRTPQPARGELKPSQGVNDTDVHNTKRIDIAHHRTVATPLNHLLEPLAQSPDYNRINICVHLKDLSLSPR